MNEEPWYANGLNFGCTGCGACCTGSPGYIWVNEEEILAISNHLGLSVQEFGRKYLRKVNGRFSLTERRVSYDCIFLKEKKCTIYEVRPLQCRTYPWWPEMLSSEEEWLKGAHTCEGICKEAPLVPLETIEKEKKKQENYNQAQ